MPLRSLRKKPQPPAAAAGSQVQTELDRPTANEIYEQVSRNARHELERSAIGLFISGLAGGMTMGLTALSTSIVISLLGLSPWARFVADMLYPLGFIAVIVGRAQLFTENTLYPVALMLAERRHYLRTLRFVVHRFCPVMFLGAFFFALLASRTGALRPEVVATMTHMGVEATRSTTIHVFWSGVIGGWIIALVAWLVSGSHSITGSVMLIWLLTFIVGLGGFAHCIATSGEILAAVLDNQLALSTYFAWLAPGRVRQHLRWRTVGNSARVRAGARRRGTALLPLRKHNLMKEDKKTTYPPIESYALIGDCETAALVSLDGFDRLALLA